MKYFKTDKNGTKYYMDTTCRKCGGHGGSNQWAYTGWTCFRCGGSGIDPNPQIIKEYTEEYAAKLQTRREKKAQKELNERIAKFQAEKEQNILNLGFGKEDNEYVIYKALGNTFDIKDELKSDGYKFRPEIGWFKSLPTSTKVLHQRMTSTELLQENPTFITWKSLDEIKPLLKTLESKSEWQGNQGDKIDKIVKVKFQFESTYHPTSWVTNYLNTYIMEDEQGNVYKWTTEKVLPENVRIRGTIKDLTEYKGTKQTVLTRCQFKEV